MRMSEITFQGQPPIDGYGPGGFRIQGTWQAGVLLLGPDCVRPLPATAAHQDLTDAVLMLQGAVDLLLLGQGAEIAPAPAPLRDALDGAGLGFEVMSTPSACRTYNVLLSEGRRVGALLRPL